MAYGYTMAAGKYKADDLVIWVGDENHLITRGFGHAKTRVSSAPNVSVVVLKWRPNS